MCSQRTDKVFYSTMFAVPIKHNGGYRADTHKTCSQEPGGRRQEGNTGTMSGIPILYPIECYTYSYHQPLHAYMSSNLTHQTRYGEVMHLHTIYGSPSHTIYGSPSQKCLCAPTLSPATLWGCPSTSCIAAHSAPGGCQVYKCQWPLWREGCRGLYAPLPAEPVCSTTGVH